LKFTNHQPFCFGQDLSFHVFTFIESLPGFCSIHKDIQPGCSSSSLESWHRNKSPITLPRDLVGFLQFNDGLSVRWKALNVHSEITVGSFNFNSLKDMIFLDDAPPIPRCSLNVEGDEGNIPSSAPTVHQRVALLIERHQKVGDVALVYDLDGEGNVLLGHAGSFEPEVWFRDNRVASGAQGADLPSPWHYVARSFSCYYRLAIVHLGIIGWQFAFTPRGLAPLTVQWMRLYCPERLCLDMANRAQP
jgi:tubulin polyglutamylase complex subunit 2